MNKTKKINKSNKHLFISELTAVFDVIHYKMSLHHLNLLEGI